MLARSPSKAFRFNTLRAWACMSVCGADTRAHRRVAIRQAEKKEAEASQFQESSQPSHHGIDRATQGVIGQVPVATQQRRLERNRITQQRSPAEVWK